MANNAGNGLDIIISVKGDVTDFQKKLTGLSKNVVQIEKDTNNASNSILSFSQKSSEAILKALQESLVGAKKGSAEYKATQQQIKEVAKATLESVKKSVEDYGTSAERAYKRIQDAAAKSSEAAAKGSNATYTEAKRNANNAVAEYDNAVRRAEEGVKRADELAQTLGTKTAESMKQQAEAVLALAKSQKQAISDIYDRILDDQKNVQAQFIQNAKASAQAITGDKVQTFYMPTEEDADAPYKIITETQEAIGKVRQTIYQMSQDTGEFIPVSEKVLDEFTKQDQMVNQLANTLTNLSTKYERLSQEAQSLSSKTGENYSLSETAQDDAEKLRTLAEELRNEKITIDDAAKAVESFSSRLLKNQNQLAQAKTENADMTQSYEKASNVLDKLKERLQNMSISIKAAEENGRTVAGTYDAVKESVSDLIAESDKIKNSGLTGQEFVDAVNELAKSTSNADLKFKELQKTAERMPMTMEQADAAVLSLQNGLNRMSTEVDKVKDKFVSGTFNNITTDIESLRTNLETLQIAFQNGTISEETYTRSLEMMQLQLKTLQTDLIQTKANNEKLVFTQEQAETAANKLAQSMDQLQIRINKVKNGYVSGTFNEATIAIQNNQEALRKLLNEYSKTGDLKTFGEELKKLTKEFNNTTVGLERSAEVNGTRTATGDNFIQNMGKYARWYFGGNLITGAKRQFQEALQEMKAVDAELVQVKKVTDMSDDSLKKMGDRAYEVGKAYGVAASEYLDAVAAFSRAGMKDAAEDLAELSVKASLVGDMAQDDATAMFLAIQKAYGATNDELSLILDGLNELDNKHATTIENITEGLGKVASIASVAHVGYDELAAAIGTVTAVTQRSGTEAATALRALFLNIIGDTKTEITEGETATIASIENIKDALKEYAPDVVEYAEKTKTIINPMEAIKALSTAYKERRLTEQKLMEILSGIGGKLRTSQLTALVMNWEEYESQLEHFNDSFGSADKEVENALGSWDKKVQILKNTWTQFIAESVNTDKIKGIIDKITNIIELVGNLGNALTILLGIIVTIKMQKIVTGIGQIVKSIGSLLSGTVTLATAATGLQVAFGAVALGVTAAFLALQKYRQGLHKATEEASENAARTKKHADDLSDLYINYQFAEKGSKNFKDASEKLADALKIERDELGKLNAVYDEHIKKSIEAAHQDAVIAEAAAERELQATNRTNVFNSDKYFVTKYIDQLPQKVQKQVRAIMGKALSQGTIMLGSMPMFDLDRNTRTFENVLNPKSNSTDDIMNYYSVISEIMGVIAESSQDAEEGFNLVGNAAYESAQKVIGLYSASVDAYTSEHQHKLELEAQLVILDAVSKGILKDEESLKEWSEEIQNSTEYSDEFKEVILRLAEAMKVDLLGTIEDVNEGAEDAADAVEEATSAVKKFQDALKEKNTDALDDYVKLFKEFKEAADSGKYGSKQFQYGLQALFTDEKIASANGDWASLAKEAEKLQKALSSADNSGIEFFDYLKKEGKSIGDHVWEIADGILTIKQNSNGSWSWDIFGETAERGEILMSADLIYINKQPICFLEIKKTNTFYPVRISMLMAYILYLLLL